ncbi:uncharacterized protein N7477_005656 [Penicillium maclennaniae]|uniref:uncharacterized protein n=1 Tax=Penicillium maclennaniae TaxID=1343394 RepID=UPI0025403A9C|nr:uncharacterized protein N7477_005656 [Penicillium maclennaniae]KAJ5670293.1 hypothetical protein N7477_005656 [Penicillium maclennaniae]
MLDDDFIPRDLQENIMSVNVSDGHERDGYSIYLDSGNYENDLQVVQDTQLDVDNNSPPITSSVPININGERPRQAPLGCLAQCDLRSISTVPPNAHMGVPTRNSETSAIAQYPVSRPFPWSTGITLLVIHSYEPAWKDNGFCSGPTQEILRSKAAVPYHGSGIYSSAAAARRVMAGAPRALPQPLPQWDTGMCDGFNLSDPELGIQPRTAVIMRTWLSKRCMDDDLHFIRAMIMELALHSGGEYEVVLLVDCKDTELPNSMEPPLPWTNPRQSIRLENWASSPSFSTRRY